MYFISLTELCVYMLVGGCCCAVTKIQINGRVTHSTHKVFSKAE